MFLFVWFPLFLVWTLFLVLDFHFWSWFFCSVFLLFSLGFDCYCNRQTEKQIHGYGHGLGHLKLELMTHQLQTGMPVNALSKAPDWHQKLKSGLLCVFAKFIR